MQEVLGVVWEHFWVMQAKSFPTRDLATNLRIHVLRVLWRLCWSRSCNVSSTRSPGQDLLLLDAQIVPICYFELDTKEASYARTPQHFPGQLQENHT